MARASNHIQFVVFLVEHKTEHGDTGHNNVR